MADKIKRTAIAEFYLTNEDDGSRELIPVGKEVELTPRQFTRYVTAAVVFSDAERDAEARVAADAKAKAEKDARVRVEAQRKAAAEVEQKAREGTSAKPAPAPKEPTAPEAEQETADSSARHGKAGKR